MRKQSGVLNDRILMIIVLISCFITSTIYAEIDNQEVIHFFNENILKEMKNNDLVGCAISVVHNNDVIFSQGYGHADLKNRIKVDPEKTLFRAGSVSKLFTWIAVMKLVEEGVLSLDENINTYLGDIQIPDTFEKPITLRYLMSHTPGFEDYVFGLFTKDQTKLKSLRNTIVKNMPKRVLLPGEEISYSNYGASLSGYIIEHMTGISFEQYIYENIFKPLNMMNTTFQQPVPVHLQPYLSKGYAIKNNIPVEQDFEFVQGTPAGGMSGTADDMSKFLLFMLHQGALNNRQILKQETIEKMHQTLFKPDNNANGFAHGIMERDLNDVKVFGHGGDTIYFHSLCYYVPEYNLGIFMATNTDTGMIPIEHIFNNFLNYFFPAPFGKNLAIENTRSLVDYVNTYIANRRSESTITKLLSLFWNIDVNLSSDRQGLNIFNFITQENGIYVEIAPQTFQRIDGTDRYVFLENKENKIEAVFDNTIPVITFKKIPIIENRILILAILALAVIVMLSGIIVRPIGILMLLNSKKKFTKLERLIGGAGSLLVLLYVVYIASMIITLSGDIVFQDLSPFPFIVIGITFFIHIINIFCCIFIWIKKYWNLTSRIYYTLFLTVSSAFLWLLYYWKFLFP